MSGTKRPGKVEGAIVALLCIGVILVAGALQLLSYEGTKLMCGGGDPFWSGHAWSCPVTIKP